MTHEWMVHTENGDHIVHALNRGGAIREVMKRTHGRAVIFSIERIS